MSVDRHNGDRTSDSDGGVDDFDSSSESESVHRDTAVSGGPQQTFALNKTLLTSLHETHGPGRSDSTSPEWNDEGDSDSDCWESYQREIAVKIPTDIILLDDVNRVPDLSGNTCSKSPLKNHDKNSLVIRRTTFTKSEDNEQTVGKRGNCEVSGQSTTLGDNCLKANYQGNGQTTQISRKNTFIGYEIDQIQKQTPQPNNFINGLKSHQDNPNGTATENNKPVSIIRKETFSKADCADLNTDTNNTSDLHIDRGIRPITSVKPIIPKKPNIPYKINQTHTNSENIITKSPQLNRKFNSVSPKRKGNLKPSTVIENRSLALSLDGQLDKQTSTLCQQKEEVDEGISSDDESKKSLPTNCEGRATSSIRRSTYTKRMTRPKSEAFLDSAKHEERSQELCKSSVSVNSVSESVQSAESEENKINERQNDEAKEAEDDLKDLDNKKPNFAFIRVSTNL